MRRVFPQEYLIAVAAAEVVHKAVPVALKDCIALPLHTGLAGWQIVRKLYPRHNSCKNVAPREPSYRMPGSDALMSVPYVFSSWTRQLMFIILNLSYPYPQLLSMYIVTYCQ